MSDVRFKDGLNLTTSREWSKQHWSCEINGGSERDGSREK